MQKSNRLPWILVALLVALNIVVLTVVWMRPPFPPPHRHGPGHAGGPPPRGGLGREIGMTADKIEAVEGLTTEHFRRLDGFRDQIIALRLEAFANFGTATEDSAAAHAILAKIGDLQVAIETERFRHFHEVLAMCSPEEAAKFKEVLPRILARKSQPENRPDGPPNGGPRHGGPPPQD